MIWTIAEVVVGILTAIVALVTVLPFWRTHHWWVRVCDFPRLQVAIATIILLVSTIFVAEGWIRIVMMAAQLAVLTYQFMRIFPFTPLARREMGLDSGTDGTVTIMASNVLMENEHYDRVRDAIEKIDPDILLLMEVDQTWDEAVSPALSRYDTVLREVKDNYYGMILATRMPVEDASIVYLTKDDTPTAFAEMRDAAGRAFRFVGLHPQPPIPGEDTDDRDAEMLYSALFARKSGVPVVVAGDFNDAAWSHTSRRFKRVGGFLDPRVGRGMIPSFDANSYWMRAPIDQFYATEDVAVRSFELGPNVGSDHFPVVVRVAFDPELARKLNRPGEVVDEVEMEDLHEIANRHADKLKLKRIGEDEVSVDDADAATEDSPEAADIPH